MHDPSNTTKPRALVWCLAALMIACGGPKVGNKTSDSGAGDDDAGSSTPAPDDRVFAVGVSDNAGGAPNGAPRLNLSFHGGTPSADLVVSKRLAGRITLDGLSDDWSDVPESVVPLQARGGPIGVTATEWASLYGAIGVTAVYDFGVSELRIRSAWDDEAVYFLLSWADATESRQREQWVVDGGALVRTKENEDHADFAFEVGDTFPQFRVAGCAAACHIKTTPTDTSPAGIAYRFSMHTLDAGQLVDVWDWKAFTTDLAGHADDAAWTSVRRTPDAPRDFVTANVTPPDAGPAQPRFMSGGGLGSNPVAIYLEDAGTPAAVPFDGAGLDPNVRIPGYVHQQAGDLRAHVRSAGRWHDGRWTVEFQRALVTQDPFDAQFEVH